MTLGYQDKQEITESIHLYCFGVDRQDRNILTSLALEDATVDYGDLYRGDWKGLVDYLLVSHSNILFHDHSMTNIAINTADHGAVESESRVIGKIVVRKPDESVMELDFLSRYIDGWKKVDGRWLITGRRLLRDYRRVSLLTKQELDARYTISH